VLVAVELSNIAVSCGRGILLDPVIPPDELAHADVDVNQLLPFPTKYVDVADANVIPLLPPQSPLMYAVEERSAIAEGEPDRIQISSKSFALPSKRKPSILSFGSQITVL
jgi:hypothetical protein